MFESFFYLIKQGFKNLWNNSIMTIASIGVLLSCMLLIGAATLLTINVSSLIESIESKSEAIVYLSDDISDDQIESVKNSIMLTGKISSIEFVSKDNALKDMMSSLGDNGILFEAYSKNGKNNLPNSFRITFYDVSNMGYTISTIEAIEGVYSVSALTEVANVISGIKRMVYIGGIVIITILILVSLMIIGNTIKITVFNRKREIGIMKYVGATNAFIQFPFIIEGGMIGIISGLLAYFILYFGYSYLCNWFISNQSDWLSLIISGIVPFSTISLQMLVGFIGGGIIMGVIGCLISSSKYTRV